MPDQDKTTRHFRSASEDREILRKAPQTPQTCSSAYCLAFDDEQFLLRDELRPVRLQLELMKAQMVFEEENVNSTVVIFGGARIPAPGAMPVRTDDPALVKSLKDKAHYYEAARRFAQLVSEYSLKTGGRDWMICSGGGPGVMEAANRGADDVGAKSIGLNIVLPHEQAPNPYVTPELSLQFHYFAIRKMQFLMNAKALAVFPGGFGTLDETFETLTLIQTGRVAPMPVLLFGESFWRRIINFEALAEEGTISPDDLDLFSFVETGEQGWEKIRQFYGIE
ncbi:MAG: 3-isopropylmalate dehydrogenase [Robiginitomaculum sp.]|nr:MAG: 3-isopropylmalate dehydrogenase [Robiginitomaculum sp.]